MLGSGLVPRFRSPQQPVTPPDTTTALILVAGTGSRLRPLTADRPKALVEVAGQPMLGALLSACVTAGVESVVLVTGYHHLAIETWLADHPPGVPVTTVFNEAYERLGNAWSVYTARDALEGKSFVKLDGDLVLDGAILAGLLGCPWGSAIAMDSQVTLDEEAMKAMVDASGQVRKMGKWLPIEGSTGESIGVEKIAAADGPRLFDTIERLVRQDGKGDAYYEDAYHAMIEQGWPLGAYDIGDGRWAEIDDARDLERARKRFS